MAARRPRSTFHHGDTRRAARDAALALLTEEGSQALGLRAVAERIGVNHRALYRHFPSLEALKIEVAAEGFTRLAARIERVAPRDERALARAYGGFALGEPHLYDLMFSLPLRRWYGTDHPIGPALRRVVAAAASVVGHSHAETRVFRLWGLVHGLVGLYRTGAWRAQSTRQAVTFIASLV
ncbi:TetR/AcrR family transcriptional regulator [Reyranella sp.]|uniref:TetR/AcrR family transcriptional regulator n=1 Tax=Reyranella sp. TaxID=1929291 RepID=UPI003BAD0CF4